MKKKILLVILSVCMILSAFGAISVSAAEETETDTTYDGELAVEGRSGKIGESVEITVRASSSFDAACLVFTVDYDTSIFTLQDVVCSVDEGTFVYNENPANPKFIWYNTGNHHFDDTTIFMLSFKIKDSATEGNYPITLNFEENDICDENGEKVSLKVEGKTVYIFRYYKGDTDNDLCVSGSDIVYLARYLVDLETEIEETNADVNGDGSVDGRDLVKLARHIAGVEFVPELNY